MQANTYLLFNYLFNRFHHDYNAKKDYIKHHKKYKNPICKSDKNESLPQPIKCLSSSSYELIEDYVTYCICRSVRKAAK